MRKSPLSMILLSCLLMTGCSAARTNQPEHVGYRFDDNIGIQSASDDAWYKGEDLPMTLATEEGKVEFAGVLWQDNTLYTYINIMNREIADRDDYSEYLRKHVYMESPGIASMGSSHGIIVNEDAIPVKLHWKVPYGGDVKEQYIYHIFDQTVTVKMVPLPTYADLEDIGTTVTHNGRSLVWVGDKIYPYTEDLWEISQLNETNLPIALTLKQYGKETYFCSRDQGSDTVQIARIGLTADVSDQNLIVEIPIPQDETPVSCEIPFSVGEDTYQITEIHRLPGEKGATKVELTVKPVEMEDGTSLVYIEASRGVFTERTYDVYTHTGEHHTEPLPPAFGVDEDWIFGHYVKGMANSPLTMHFRVDTEIPETVQLRIETVSKNWDQPYEFGIATH